MKYPVEEIIAFLSDLAGTNDIQPDSDIVNEIGMDGDDFHEMIEKFAEKFSVDMSGYLWYFHSGEEGFWSIGGIFFAPSYDRVKRIPVTPAMLIEFANKGKWDIIYPEHRLPKYRFDILINKIILMVFVAALVINLMRKCTS